MRPLVVLAVVIALVFQLGLRYLPFGRRLFAIGSNPDAARVAGLPVQRDIFCAFVLSGALAGLAGFMFLARFGNITVMAGQGLELQVVAAVVVGGVNIFGGVGSMIGALLGATLIELLQQSLIRWLDVSEFLRDAILGCSSCWRSRRTRSSSAGCARSGSACAGGSQDLGRAASERGTRCVSWRRRLRSWEGLLLVILIVVVALNALAAPGYLTVQNQVNLFQLGVEKAIVVLSMAFVIISGEIDLSVASVMGLAAVVVAWSDEQGVSIEAGDPRRPCGRAPVWACSTASGSRSSACRRWP